LTVRRHRDLDVADRREEDLVTITLPDALAPAAGALPVRGATPSEALGGT
jgi:hypothetical protein